MSTVAPPSRAERSPKRLGGSLSARQRWAALTVLCLSLVVVTIDTTILNVALPSLQRVLRPSASGLEWIVDAYTVVFAGLLLSAGALGDRFGRKWVLSAGLVMFALTSGGSALVHSTGALIVLRAATGIGAAMIFPATLSILTNIFTDPAERQKAIVVWAGTAGIGIGLGPVAGGLLLRHFFWGSIFWVNVPVCLVAVVAGLVLIPDSRDPGESHLDLPGAALSIVGLSTFVFAVIEGPNKGWLSTEVIGAFVGAVIVLVIFAQVELRRAHPMLDLRLFRNPRFTAASLGMTTLYFALFGTIFFQTQQLQIMLGYDPLGAGLRSLPFAFVLLVVANTTPRLVARVGTRPVVTTGLLVVGLSMAGRGVLTVHSGYDAVLWTQCVFALGMGLTIAPATASIMGAVPKERAGVGSAINDTTRQVGGALGVAVMGSVGASLFHTDIAHRLAGVHLSPAVAATVHQSVGAAVGATGSMPAAQAAAVTDAARHAFIHSQDVASLIGMVVVVVGAVVAYRFLPAGRPVVAPIEASSVELELELEREAGLGGGFGLEDGASGSSLDLLLSSDVADLAHEVDV